MTTEQAPEAGAKPDQADPGKSKFPKKQKHTQIPHYSSPGRLSSSVRVCAYRRRVERDKRRS